MDNKKTVVLGITGGVAAFKAVQLTSDLIKKGYDVEVIMTKNAMEFIQPLSFEALTHRNVMYDTFQKGIQKDVRHVSIAQKADVFVIVPASANVIAKIAHGLADDMLTTTFLAASCPKIIAPAMNTGMYDNPITQNNLALCKTYGMEIIDPADGFLACGTSGRGKLANIADIMECIEAALTAKTLLHQKILITAGPTQEDIDPVRYITNHSSGKMGYALARMAKRMGADVTLISGPCMEEVPYGVNRIMIRSAQDMFEAVQKHYQNQDYIIKAAAVGDYRPLHIADEKIKKQDASMTLELMRNPDILSWLGEHVENHQVLCGFAMETCELKKHALEKLQRKHADMIAANSLRQEGAGFQSDTNIMTLFTKEKEEALPLLSKLDTAKEILERLLTIRIEKMR